MAEKTKKENMKKDNTRNENTAEGKVITKYDRKKQQREAERARERRNKKITIAVLIVIAIGIVAALSAVLYQQYNKRFGTYVTIGNYEIKAVEYDYYYNNSLNNFMSTYGSYASYFGLDTSKDLSAQQYTDDMSWADYFDQNAMNALQQAKALKDDAEKNGFTYNTDEEYNAFVTQMQSAADEAGTSLKEYYKTAYGTYATQSSIETVERENLFVNAYYKHLEETQALTDAEKDTYYAENKDIYDLLDYRIMTVMDETKANAMLAAVTDSESFKNLCIEYAEDTDKESYQNADTSLKQSQTQSQITADSAAIAWLMDASRKEGDKAVFEDSNTKGTFYVVYFINRYTNDTQKDSASAEALNERLSAYIEELCKNYDLKAGLKHVTEWTTAATAE